MKHVLESMGVDVAHMLEIEASAPDRDVIPIALHQDRLLVTYDRRLSALIFVEGLQHPGILLVRDLDLTPEEQAAVTARVVCARYNELRGNFSTISNGRLRINRGGRRP
jgi:predicted nuclease of predicted toxin-antitoxin system